MSVESKVYQMLRNKGHKDPLAAIKKIDKEVNAKKPRYPMFFGDNNDGTGIRFHDGFS